MKTLIFMAFITIGLVVNVNAQDIPISVLSSEEINNQGVTDVSDILARLPCGPISRNTKGIVIRGHATGGVSGITRNGFGFSDTVDEEESSSIFSFTVGADIRLPLFKCDNFGFRTGLSFQSQGAKFMEMDEYDDYDYTLKLNYLKAPAIVEYYVNDKFDLYGGIKIGYLLSANWEEEGYPKQDAKEYLKSTDFSGTLGAEYNIYCSDKFSLGAGINYDFGLSDISDSEYNNDKYKNSSIGALITASF